VRSSSLQYSSASFGIVRRVNRLLAEALDNHVELKI